MPMGPRPFSAPPTVATHRAALPEACEAAAVSQGDLDVFSQEGPGGDGSYWQAAYGAGPCHRAAKTAAQWRQAVQEKVAIEARLRASLGKEAASPAALLGVAKRLEAPVAALLAFRIAGREAEEGEHGTYRTLDLLTDQKRYDDLAEYVPAALKRHPRFAGWLMDVAVDARHVGLYAAVVESGANLDCAVSFNPAKVAQEGDAEVLRYLMRHRHGTSPGEWSAALGITLQRADFSLADELWRSVRCKAWVDLAAISDRGRRTELLAWLKDHKVDPGAVLSMTSASLEAGAREACDELRDAFYTPAQWQAALDGLCADILKWPHTADPRRLCAVLQLGGRVHGVAAMVAAFASEYCYGGRGPMDKLNRLAVFLCAGADPALTAHGTTLLEGLLQGLACDRTTLKEIRNSLDALAMAKVALPASLAAVASSILKRTGFDAATLRSLLRMGFPPDEGRVLLACAKQNDLQAVRLLVDAGTNLFVVDDHFRTAIDLATDPAMVGELESLGLRREFVGRELFPQKDVHVAKIMGRSEPPPLPDLPRPPAGVQVKAPVPSPPTLS